MWNKMIAILMIMLLPLSGCIMGGPMGGRPLYSDDGQKADARLEQVIAAMENRDKGALRAMFSEQALSEAVELDERMDYIFDFIQGDILSWKRDAGGASAINHYGHRDKGSIYWFTVTTDEDEYLFFLMECLENTDHPENVGLYMLQVIKKEDEDTQFPKDLENRYAGIYKPPEE